jgi:hypothetical protein
MSQKWAVKYGGNVEKIMLAASVSDPGTTSFRSRASDYRSSYLDETVIT